LFCYLLARFSRDNIWLIMLTKQDKKYLHKTFATRKYLDDNFVNKKEHDQFAASVAGEFLQIHKQFVAVGKRFDKIDDRFDKMESLIEEVLVEVKDTNKKFSRTIERVDGVELHLGLSVA